MILFHSNAIYSLESAFLTEAVCVLIVALLCVAFLLRYLPSLLVIEPPAPVHAANANELDNAITNDNTKAFMTISFEITCLLFYQCETRARNDHIEIKIPTKYQ